MNRTQALCKATGLQTLDELVEYTGCKVEDLLYSSPTSKHLNSPYSHGWFAGRTCSIDFNKRINFPNHNGDVDFWIGVAVGLIMQEELGSLT